MAVVLSKLFAGIMSVVVMLSGWFPALFGGKEFIEPNSNDVLTTSELRYTDIDNAMIITDYETALKHFGFEENGELNEKYFETSNIVAIPVTIPDSACKVFVESVWIKNDKVTVNYSFVHDICVGATFVSAELILIEVDKNVKEVEAIGKNVIVPFCVHNRSFSFDV